MESATPSTPVKMGALPSSPPREGWGTALSWCWTSSRMNTYLSGEKLVRKSLFWIQRWDAASRNVDLLGFGLNSHRRDVIWSRHQSSDPQSGGTVLHWPARLWSGSRISDFCFLPGTEGVEHFKNTVQTQRFEKESMQTLRMRINVCYLVPPSGENIKCERSIPVLFYGGRQGTKKTTLLSILKSNLFLIVDLSFCKMHQNYFEHLFLCKINEQNKPNEGRRHFIFMVDV